MKRIKKTLLQVFIILTILCEATFAAPSMLDFFGAKAVGSNKKSFYVIKPGDFDGDGKVDALISGLSDVLVYFGEGNGKFSTPPVQLIENFSGIPLFPTQGDFNGDGRTDIAVRSGNSIRVYLGNADKTFSAPVFSSGDWLPRYMETVDFDGDSMPDLVGGGSGSDGNSISLYKGAGNGSFTFIERINTFYEVLPIVSDFNNDSKPDIFFTNNGVHLISLNTNGHFGTPVSINIDPLVRVEGICDFNGDGIQDIVSTDGTVNPFITIWLGTGNLTFI